MYYGNEAATETASSKVRYYSPAGDIEVDFDKATNKYIVNIYVDGDPYTASIIQRKENSATAFYYLHRDYLGSILAITNSTGSIVEKRHFDAWGNVLLVQNGQGNALDRLTFLERGYTGHEHLQGVGLIHMNGRLYDAKLHRFLAPDNFVQDPFNTQNFNRYSYVLNNPLLYTDPSGEIIWAPIIIGAIIGAYTGGVIANDGKYDPREWDYSSGKTWGYMFGGAVVGGLSGWAGSAIASSGIPMANTLGISGASLANSLGTHIYTGGETPISISFGIGSYDFTNNEWGYLGKKGNSFLENLGYGLGAMANVSDVLVGFKPNDVQLNTENDPNFSSKGDYIGHSQLSDHNGNILIDWGPAENKSSLLGLVKGTNSYKQGVLTENLKGNSFWNSIYIKNVNVSRMMRISDYLNKGGKYNLLYNSCVSMASRALNLSGVFNIGIHPYLLHTQMYLRSIGIRPMLYSHFLTN